MKRHTITAVLIAATLILFASFVPQSRSNAKTKAGAECSTCDLDATYRLVTGQRGFYQLTDEEGGVDFNQFNQLEPGGRKVPAVLNALQFERNEDGSLVFSERGGLTPVRDKDGTIVVCVHVLRPANKGGAFDRCDAVYGSRGAGGFDIVQAADLVGF